MELIFSRWQQLKKTLVAQAGFYIMLGLFVIAWLAYAPAGILGKADALGYAVCHRIEARSFSLHGTPMPLCARCSGMYLGAIVGLAYQALHSRKSSGYPPLKVAALLGLFVVAFAVDGLNSFLQLALGYGPLYTAINPIRLFTGLGMGLVMAAALYPAFGQSAWVDYSPEPALPDWRSLAIIFAAAALVGLLILTDAWIVLYPLALISAAGVWLVLGLLHTVIWILLLRRENRYTSLRQLTGILVLGFGSALAQIFVIDVVRYSFTHTWGSFPMM